MENASEPLEIRRVRLQWIAALLLITVGALTVVGYWLGGSTLRGWTELARDLPDSITSYDAAVALPARSRVIFHGSTVAHLTSYRSFPRERALGGPLLIFEGEWQPGSRTDQVHADTTLIARMTGNGRSGTPVLIELLDEPPPEQNPRGLLRLRPFRRGYHIY
jgi:hypothetical protein